MDRLRKDCHLATIKWYVVLMGFSVGALVGYQLPENKDAGMKWNGWLRCQQEFMASIGVLDTLKEFVDGM